LFLAIVTKYDEGAGLRLCMTDKFKKIDVHARTHTHAHICIYVYNEI